MKKLTLIAALTMMVASAASAQTLISGFTFESLASTFSVTGSSPGTLAADSGNGSATAFHTTATSVYTSPAGDGSARSLSANNFTVGDYFQFSLSTVGSNGIFVAFGQTGSNTGPTNFNLQYSTNGGTTFTVAGGYTVTNDSWSATGGAKAASFKTFDLSAITALNNNANVVFQIIDTSTTAITGGTVATGGTDRVDDFNVSTGGFILPAVVPEPATYAYILGGLGVMALIRRRRLA